MADAVESPIWKAVDGIMERLEKLEAKLGNSLESITPTNNGSATVVTPASSDPQEIFPVPADYRRIVDTELNKEFGIKVVPRADSPQFEVLITVPNKYTQMSDEYKKLYGVDIRTRVLSFADAANGVRQFCEIVFKSFNPTIQALIVADRVNA